MFYVILDDLNYLLNNHLHDIMSHPVLLVYDGVRRQNLQRLDPAGVHRLVFGGRDRKELRERYPEGDRNVGLLAEDAPLLDGEDREFALQCCGFQYASHRKSGN